MWSNQGLEQVFDDNERKEVKLEQSDGEKDIGVLVDETISFSTHNNLI
jgi:hypothetical protein